MVIKAGLLMVVVLLGLIFLMGCDVEQSSLEIGSVRSVRIINGIPDTYMEVVGYQMETRLAPGEDVVIRLGSFLFPGVDDDIKIEIAITVWDSRENGKFIGAYKREFWLAENENRVWIVGRGW